MPSLIDFTKPIYGTPTTQSVRDNFQIAQVEITDLQNIIAEGPFVPLDGGEMTGLLTLVQDPINGDHAATKRYVDNIAFGGGSGGAPDAPKDGMFYARGGAATPTDGNDWTADPLFSSLLIGSDKDTPLFGIRADATNNYYDFLNDGQNLFQFNRATKILDLKLNNTVVANFSDTDILFNKPLTLSADPTTAMHAVTKQYVDAKSGGASLTVADTPPAIAQGKMWFNSNQTQLYVGYDDGTSSQWVIANNQNVLTTGAINTALQPTYNNVGRNVLHNGLFNIAQRGNGAFNANGYTVDRWAVWRDTDTGAITRLATSVGGMAFDESSAYYMLVDFTGSAVANAHTALYQNIEDVRRLAGKTVTVSFYALCWAGSIKLGVSLGQNFGTGGSPSAVVNIAGQSVTLNQAWQRYSVTLTLPSIAGKTLGTNDNSLTGLNLFFSSGSANAIRSGNVGVQTGKVQLYGVQLEIGNVATPLEKPDPQVNLANCQRFYLDSISSWYGTGTGGQSMGGFVPFKTTMRGVPTITFYSTGYTNASAVGAYSIDPNGFICNAVATANGAASLFTGYKATADL